MNQFSLCTYTHYLWDQNKIKMLWKVTMASNSRCQMLYGTVNVLNLKHAQMWNVMYWLASQPLIVTSLVCNYFFIVVLMGVSIPTHAIT